MIKKKGFEYKGKIWVIENESDSSFNVSTRIFDGNNLIFETLSFLPILTKDVENAIDEYLLKQRKDKLEKLNGKI